MVLESTEQPIKRGRGRPRKTPMPENNKIESKQIVRTEKTPSVSKKDSKVGLQKKGLTREEELEAFETRSNKSGFLTLLILVLGIALIGYGMYQKIHQEETTKIDDKPQKQTKTVVTSPVTTGSKTTTGTTTTTGSTGDVQPSTTPSLPKNDTSNLLGQYFDLVNKGDTPAFTKLQDTSFNVMAPLRTYFNSSRLATFVANTTDGIHITDIKSVTDDPVIARNPTAKVYDFLMKYTLKQDGKDYADAWRGYTVVKGTGDTATTVINGFVYEGKSSSTSPFFQFAKYNIK